MADGVSVDLVVDFDGDLNVADRRAFRATSHVADNAHVYAHEKVLKSSLGGVFKALPSPAIPFATAAFVLVQPGQPTLLPRSDHTLDLGHLLA